MKKILLSFAVVVISGIMALSPLISNVPTYAAEKCTLTSILGNAKCNEKGEKESGGAYNCSCDSGDGDSARRIILLVADIMSIGIGIFGVIGISIVGVQYLTAGGNEEKARKAKRRMLEIVIGLAAYVVLYAALKWIMPNFDNTSNTSNTSNSSTTNSYGPTPQTK